MSQRRQTKSIEGGRMLNVEVQHPSKFKRTTHLSNVHQIGRVHNQWVDNYYTKF